MMDGVKTLEEFPTIAHKVKNDILSYLWKIGRSFFSFLFNHTVTANSVGMFASKISGIIEVCDDQNSFAEKCQLTDSVSIVVCPHQ